MSQANVNPKYHPRSEAPATGLESPKISYYSDHVTIRVPNGQWNEALQEQAQSANIRPDPGAVAELIASERSQPAANQGSATAARPILHSDSRDAIPLTYCNGTRRTIAIAGSVVSSATILGVHLAAISDRVPGFQPLTMLGGGSDPTESREGEIIPIGLMVGGLFSVVAFLMYLWKYLADND